MIAQTVAAVDEGAEAPPDLRLAWLCGAYHLPEAGAMLDQDAGLMTRMRACDNVYRTLSRFRGLKGHAIHGLTAAERKVLRLLKDDGLLARA